MPIDIDMNELKKFIYELNFSGVKIKALGVEGYYHAAYPYLKSLTTDLVFGPSAAVNNGSVMFCVARATAVITVDGKDKCFSALGSCGSNEQRVKMEFMADVAETRAMKRVLHRALDLTRFDIRDIEDVDSNDRDSAPTKPQGAYNDLSIPEAVLSGAAAAGLPRKSKLPSGGDCEVWE